MLSIIVSIQKTNYDINNKPTFGKQYEGWYVYNLASKYENYEWKYISLNSFSPPFIV